MTQRLYDDRLTIADHPFITDRLTAMRDVDTPSPVFRENLKFIAQFLAYECLSDFPIEHRVVETPVQLSKQPTLPDTAPALISILRAGNYMVDGALALSPASPIGMVGKSAAANNEIRACPRYNPPAYVGSEHRRVMSNIRAVTILCMTIEVYSGITRQG